MNKVHQMLHGFLEFKKNIETWNKLTKLGCLLLLGPLRMLKTWYA